MKVVVIGGSGLIGRKVVELLTSAGHEAVAASRSTGVDAITGVGLAGALAGAAAVVDVTNAPVRGDEVLAFFRTSTGNVLAAERAAGVRHHVVLSIVGADTLPAGGYMRAKVAQEELIKASGVPFTIVRATQFYEFLEAIADGATVDGEVRGSTARFQPVAADDVAAFVAEVAVAPPLNGTVDLAGPEVGTLASFLRHFLDATYDERKVVEDPDAAYFGTRLDEKSLVPSAAGARLGAMTFPEWLSR